MSFGFGQQNKATGFGGFGQSSTNPSSSFGGFGTSSAPAFGSSSGPAFGSGLGSSPGTFGGTSNQASGTLFGTPSSTPSSGFGGAKFGTSSGTSAFGQSSATPFGQPAAPSFGTTQSGPAFGSTGSGFGSPNMGTASTGAGTSIFGSPQTSFGRGTGSAGFGAQDFGSNPGLTSAFGAAPASGSFGTTAGTGGAFTNTNSTLGGGSIFGKQGGFGTATTFGGTPAQGTKGFGIGGGTSVFGGLGTAAQPGTGNPPYQATQQYDSNTNAPTYIQAITVMDAYKDKSFEELRWEDYQRGNNKGTVGTPALGGGMGLGSSAFGGGLTGAGRGLGTGLGSSLGTTFGQQSTPSSFGTSSVGNTTGSAFGTSPGFGAAAKPAAPSFGTNSGTTGSIFGQQSPAPASTTSFGTGGTGGFGSLGTAQGFNSASPAPAPSPFATASSFGTSGPSTFGTPGTGLGTGFGNTPGFGTGGAFGGSKAPAPSAFGTGFGTPSATSSFGTGGLGTPAPASGDQKPFSSSFGTPSPGLGLGGFGTPTTGFATSTPSFSNLGKTPAPASMPGFPTFGTANSFGSGSFGQMNTTPQPSTPFTPSNFALGGKSMQSALQQTPASGNPGSLPSSGVGYGAAQFAATPSLLSPLSPSASDPLQLLVSSSSSKRGGRSRLRSDSLSVTPLALQSYRHTPRSAARIVPRGLRANGVTPTRGHSGDPSSGHPHPGEMDAVSPGADTFGGRPHKELELPDDEIFAVEGKPFDDEDEGHSRPFLASGGSLIAPHPSRTSEQAVAGSGSQAPDEGRDIDAIRDPNAELMPVRSSGLAPKLTMEGYRTKPSMQELASLSDEELRSVEGFTVIREDYGEIRWEGLTDATALDLDEVVRIEKKEVRVYGERKEAGGSKLNKPAMVTLYNVKHRRQTPETYRNRLRDIANNWDGASFKDYDAQTGRWTFRVSHFSRYGLDDDDEDESKDYDAQDYEDQRGRALFGISGDQMEHANGYGAPDSDEEYASSEDPTTKTGQVVAQQLLSILSGSSEDEDDQDLASPPIPRDFKEKRRVSLHEQRLVSQLQRRRFSGASTPDAQRQKSLNDEMDTSQAAASPARSMRGSTMRGVDPLAMRGLSAVSERAPEAQSAPSLPRKPLDIGHSKSPMRLSWGPGEILVLPSAKIAAKSSTRQPGPPSHTHRLTLARTVQLISTGVFSQDVSWQKLITGLQVHHRFSTVSSKGNGTRAPAFRLSPAGPPPSSPAEADVFYYLHVVRCVQELSAAAEEEKDSIRDAWRLVNALWGQEVQQDGELRSRALPLPGSLARTGQRLLGREPVATDWERRYQSLGVWLKSALHRYTESVLLTSTEDAAVDLQNIFCLLTTHRIEDAATLAMRAGFMRLALLIPLSDRKPYVDLLRQPIAMPHDRLEMTYGLLAGHPDAMATPWGRGLDWMQQLGICMWYISASTPGQLRSGNLDTLTAALQYFFEQKTCAPVPNWMDPSMHVEYDLSQGPHALAYNLLQLYCNETHPSYHTLDPRGVSSNELDCHVSWQLMTILGALGIGVANFSIWQSLTGSMAHQLLSCGAWIWAIYVLLHQPGHQKDIVIKDLVLRHAGQLPEGSQGWQFMIHQLGIAHEWLHTARASWHRSTGCLYSWPSPGEDSLSHAFSADGCSRTLCHELVSVIAGPAVLVDDLRSELESLLVKVRGHAEQYLKAPGRRCMYYHEYLKLLADIDRGTPWDAIQRRLVTELLPLTRGNLQSWGCSQVSPQDGGQGFSTYAQRTTLAPNSGIQSVVQAMILSDVVKKIFTVHRLLLNQTPRSDSCHKRIFPVESDPCEHLDDLLQEYRTQQHSYLVGDMLRRVDSIHVGA